MSDYEERREERLTDIMVSCGRNVRSIQNIIRNAYDAGYADGRKFGKKEIKVKLLLDGKQVYPREEANNDYLDLITE